MVDFEQISDTFEDGFEKVKDFTKKNKVLAITLVGVGGFALYKFFTSKTTSEDTEYVSTYAYVPTAYDGYPTMSESVSYDDVVNQLRTETTDINNDFYNETMSNVSQMVENALYENDKKYQNIIDSMSSYDNNLTTMSYLEEQRIKAQMQANSEAWHSASDSEKARLEAENQRLGASLGAEFDSASGTWYQDGQSLYDVSVKNKTNSSTANLTNVGVTETDTSKTDVIAQMKANSEAWHSASDSEKARLEAENQRLGASIGAVHDSATGTWSTSSGSSLYTVSTSSKKSISSTSTNVASTSKTSSGSSGSSKSSSSSSSPTVTSVTKNADGTYTHKWSNGKTTVQTQKNGGIVLS